MAEVLHGYGLECPAIAGWLICQTSVGWYCSVPNQRTIFPPITYTKMIPMLANKKGSHEPNL